MAFKVFISHAAHDKELAEAAKEQLIFRGYLPDNTVFIDAFDISVGENVRERLKSEMESSESVVLVLTEEAQSSQWVNYEAGLADALGKRIVIVGRRGSGKTMLLNQLSQYQHVELEDTVQ